MKQRVNRYLVLSSILLMISCSGGAWQAQDKDKFISECKAEGGDSGYCQCYLEGVMEKYPNANDAERIDFETSVELAGKCK